MLRNSSLSTASSLAVGFFLTTSAPAVSVSATFICDDCETKEQLVMRNISYTEMFENARTLELYSSVQELSALEIGKDSDDSVVWLPASPVQKKLTKNFHFLGKKKYETIIHPDFFE